MEKLKKLLYNFEKVTEFCTNLTQIAVNNNKHISNEPVFDGVVIGFISFNLYDLSNMLNGSSVALNPIKTPQQIKNMHMDVIKKWLIENEDKLVEIILNY